MIMCTCSFNSISSSLALFRASMLASYMKSGNPSGRLDMRRAPLMMLVARLVLVRSISCTLSASASLPRDVRVVPGKTRIDINVVSGKQQKVESWEYTSYINILENDNVGEEKYLLQPIHGIETKTCPIYQVLRDVCRCYDPYECQFPPSASQHSGSTLRWSVDHLSAS